MRRFFLSNAAWLLLFNILIKFYWLFGIDRVIQNTVGAEDYGRYFVVYNFVFIFSILLDLGMPNYNNRVIAQAPNLLKSYLSRILLLRGAMGLFFAVVVSIFAWIVGYVSHFLILLVPMLLLHFLSSFLTYLRSNVSGLLLFKSDTFLSVFDRSLSILLCSIFLWCMPHRFKIEWFIWIQALSYGLSVIAALIILRKQVGVFRMKWRWRFNWVFLKHCLPYASLGVLMTLYGRLDGIFLERLIGGTEGLRAAGIFAGAFRLNDSVAMVPALLAVFLLPLFAKMFKSGEDTEPLFRLSFGIIGVMGVSYTLLCFFFAEPLMHLLYTADPQQSTVVFSILCFSFFPLAMTWVFGPLLTAGAHLKVLNRIAIGTLIFNIVLNLILIPRLALSGAAIANLCTHSFCAIAQAVYVFRKGFLKHSLPFVGRFVGWALSSAVLFYGIRFLPITSWWWQAVLGVAVLGVVLLMWRLVSIKDLKYIKFENHE